MSPASKGSEPQPLRAADPEDEKIHEAALKAGLLIFVVAEPGFKRQFS
jgi:hypothetical protein